MPRGTRAGSLADTSGGGADDALLGGQELCGRVAPVAGRGRHHLAASGADMFGAGGGIGENPDDAVTVEELGRERQRLIGGDVECPGHGADGLPAGERRPQQGDGDGPGVGSEVLVDLPVVERHTLLPGQDSEDGLGVLGSG